MSARSRKGTRCAYPGCRHAPSQHAHGPCAFEGCDCAGWMRSWRHRWRRYVVEQLHAADAAWWAAAEDAGCGYATETAEWAATHPRPTLRQMLLDLAGQRG